jgi:hypothetical protein
MGVYLEKTALPPASRSRAGSVDQPRLFLVACCERPAMKQGMIRDALQALQGSIAGLPAIGQSPMSGPAPTADLLGASQSFFLKNSRTHSCSTYRPGFRTRSPSRRRSRF